MAAEVLLASGTSALSSATKTAAAGERVQIMVTEASPGALRDPVDIEWQRVDLGWEVVHSLPMGRKTCAFDGPCNFRATRRAVTPGASAIGVERL